MAEEFVKGDSGSLFFLQSTGARAISMFSKYPNEDEVLFPPNTSFEITSTLYGDSEIGAFYATVDNIAMTELTGAARPRDAASCNLRQVALQLPDVAMPELLPDEACIVVATPSCLFTATLAALSNMCHGLVHTVETGLDADGRYMGHVAIVPDPAHQPVSLPDPFRSSVWDDSADLDEPPNTPYNVPAQLPPTVDGKPLALPAADYAELPCQDQV